MEDINIIVAMIGFIGVIIGGIIASFTTLISLLLDYKSREKERKIKNLRLRKEGLEKKFTEARNRLNDDMKKDSYSSDMIANFEIIFPEKIWQAFKDMMTDKDKTEKKKVKHFYLIMKAMKESLKIIDDKIEKEINKKVFWIF